MITTIIIILTRFKVQGLDVCHTALEKLLCPLIPGFAQMPPMSESSNVFIAVGLITMA
jgi:hypothetical protein